MRFRDGRYNLMFEEWVVEVRQWSCARRSGAMAARGALAIQRHVASDPPVAAKA